MNMKQLLIGSVCCMLMGFGGASGAVYTFDGWDGITDYFSVNGSAGAYTIGDGNGLSGTDGVAFTSHTGTASLVLQTPVVSGGDVSMGIYFQYVTRVNGSGDYFSLGIGKTANYVPATTGTNDHIRFLLNHRHTNATELNPELDEIRLGLQVVSNGTQTVNLLGTTAGELTNGNWYHLGYSLTYNEVNETFALTGQIREADENGVLGNVLLSYSPASFSLPGLVNASEWYGYMSADAFPANRGLAAMDNFSMTGEMIPEPGAGLLMLAGLGLTAFARRKAE